MRGLAWVCDRATDSAIVDDLRALEECSLTTALQRLELNGWIEGEWGLSANTRRARFYKLTREGRKHLAEESARYRQVNRRGGPHYGGCLAKRRMHASGFTLEVFSDAVLRYWLDHSERQRLLWEEMGIPYRSRWLRKLVVRGVSEHEARAAAHRKFGNMTQKSEDARSTWIARWMERSRAGSTPLVSRHAARWRDLRRLRFSSPASASEPVPTVFSVVNALLLRPAPVSRSRTAGMDYQR